MKHVDGEAVEHFGYLPQDILGRSMAEFYHPADMATLRDTYEQIMIKGSTAGASFCGKPYRFLTQNGCYIHLETDWSSFINPWSRQLEFVVGHHRVIKGPKNPNVFDKFVCTETFQVSEAELQQGKIMEDAILKLLSQPVARQDSVKQQVSKAIALATFMESLTDEAAAPELKIEVPQESEEMMFSERGSVLISPHHGKVYKTLKKISTIKFNRYFRLFRLLEESIRNPTVLPSAQL